MIAVTPAGPKIVEDDQWAEQRETFKQRHCVLFKDFVDQRVLRRLRLWRAQASEEFRTREIVERNLAVTGEWQLPQETSAAGFLFLLLNQPRLFAAIKQFTGSSEDIRCFLGRYYERVPHREHYVDVFHSDADRGRLFGLSINLSEQPFVGGEFEIRCRSAGGIHHTIAAWKFGDAILFRISRSLQHRIRPVTGTVARCCYAGWFVTQPDYRDLARLIAPRPVPAARA